MVEQRTSGTSDELMSDTSRDQLVEESSIVNVSSENEDVLVSGKAV